MRFLHAKTFGFLSRNDVVGRAPRNDIKERIFLKEKQKEKKRSDSIAFLYYNKSVLQRNGAFSAFFKPFLQGVTV